MKTLKKALNTVGVLADGTADVVAELSLGTVALVEMGTDEIIGARIEQRIEHGTEWCKEVDAYRARRMSKGVSKGTSNNNASK